VTVQVQVKDDDPVFVGIYRGQHMEFVVNGTICAMGEDGNLIKCFCPEPWVKTVADLARPMDLKKIIAAYALGGVEAAQAIAHEARRSCQCSTCVAYCEEG